MDLDALTPPLPLARRSRSGGEYYNHERLHEAIPQMGARTLSKKIGPTVPEDLTTYTRQKSLFDEEEPEPSCFCD